MQERKQSQISIKNAKLNKNSQGIKLKISKFPKDYLVHHGFGTSKSELKKQGLRLYS